MKTMRGVYFFGLVVTGLLTLIPGRAMYFVVFGTDGATPAKLASFAGVLIVLSAAVIAITRWRATPGCHDFISKH